MLLAVWTLDFIWLTLPEAPRLAIELDTHVLLYTGAVCRAATLLFGLVPALHATRVDVAPLLKGETPAPQVDVRRGARMRRFFLITQFASSMALVVVAGTFVRTIVAAHVGEQSALMDHLAIAALEADEPSGPARAAHWRSVRQERAPRPGVTSVTLAPAGDGARSTLVPEGAAPVGVTAHDRSSSADRRRILRRPPASPSSRDVRDDRQPGRERRGAGCRQRTRGAAVLGRNRRARSPLLARRQPPVSRSRASSATTNGSRACFARCGTTI